MLFFLENWTYFTSLCILIFKIWFWIIDLQNLVKWKTTEKHVYSVFWLPVYFGLIADDAIHKAGCVEGRERAREKHISQEKPYPQWHQFQNRFKWVTLVVPIAIRHFERCNKAIRHKGMGGGQAVVEGLYYDKTQSNWKSPDCKRRFYLKLILFTLM